MKIATHAGTKAILEKYGLTAKKSLGQNFLIDQHVLGKIIRAADISPDDTVLEVGPGLGGLTQALSEKAGKVLAVELDKRLIEVLGDIFFDTNNVEIVHSDILDFTIPDNIKKVAANLPYYVTTPILMHLLENYQLETITIMVQKEVAQRMAAEPGTKAYGALSLAVRYHAKAEVAAYVPPNSFMPRPQVGSAVVHLTVHQSPPVDVDKKALFANIKAGFGKRRKTLVNGLFSAEIYPFTKEELGEKLKSCGFSENVRGEQLNLEEWAKITKFLTQR